MATIEAENLTQLAVVRRLEAAGFRAWPASQTEFDGTWAVRLTAGFPAKRLNSVNPLDRSDHLDIPARVERAAARFKSFGRPFLFRQSPLAPPQLVQHLDDLGWSSFGESIVFSADLAGLDLTDCDPDVVSELTPIGDVHRYIEASLVVHERPAELREGLTEILELIRPPSALFLLEEGARPVAVALAIRDNDLAGVLDVAVSADRRQRGIGRGIVTAALRHTRAMGARTAWLQVEADNAAGLAMYRKLGFVEAYRYVYRAPPA
ncbi:acetyltransferase [Aureimonas sp. SA4125]|uniref:GNAT family N-acetyltransferase n=1 Tax=Aureimonas sp. SA4125 TaxID=2826993 RepID=UPI001CC6507B|nr:GNAT family N-acetyltransferase [Aureimonas sp. SA4125]BDA86108.1 acetyltransferase [Aureimonas sp. SA4125]